MAAPGGVAAKLDRSIPPETGRPVAPSITTTITCGGMVGTTSLDAGGTDSGSIVVGNDSAAADSPSGSRTGLLAAACSAIPYPAIMPSTAVVDAPTVTILAVVAGDRRRRRRRDSGGEVVALAIAVIGGVDMKAGAGLGGAKTGAPAGGALGDVVTRAAVPLVDARRRLS